MKKILCFLIILSAIPLLCGCNSIYSNYREIEQLLVIQTMGIDRASGAVVLSLASSADSERGEGPVRLCAEGPSITETIDKIYNYSNEEDIFLAHIDQVLIGEDAASQGINEYLAYFCRSSDIRIDVPLYILKGSSAKDTMLEVGDSSKGISEIMDAVRENLDRRGDSSIFSAAEIISDLSRHGSALICAIECAEAAQTDSKPSGGKGGASESGGSSGTGSGASSDTGSGGDSNSGKSGGGGSSQSKGASGGEAEEGFGKTAAVVGYGIILDGRLCGFLDRDESIGAGFILDEVGLCDIEVRDKYGAKAVLEVEQGGSSIVPVWADDGNLKGINVHANVRASIMELNGSGDFDSPDYADYLTAQLESAVSERITAVLQHSLDLNADFLGLRSLVELYAPYAYRHMPQPFDSVLHDLELKVSVSGTISDTNDIKDV